MRRQAPPASGRIHAAPRRALLQARLPMPLRLRRSSRTRRVDRPTTDATLRRVVPSSDQHAGSWCSPSRPLPKCAARSVPWTRSDVMRALRRKMRVSRRGGPARPPAETVLSLRRVRHPSSKRMQNDTAALAPWTARYLGVTIPCRKSRRFGKRPQTGATFPLWSRDCRKLFYAALDGHHRRYAGRGITRRRGRREVPRSYFAPRTSCGRGSGMAI
jgi:hypothetical protein